MSAPRPGSTNRVPPPSSRRNSQVAQWLKNPPLTTGSPISHPDHVGSIPGLGRAPGGGNGHPLQFSCLENLRDTGAWQARAWVVTNSQRGLNEHVRSTARTRTHRLVHTLLFPPLSLSSVKEAQPPSASPQRATRCLLKIYTAIIFQRTQPSKRPRKILF